MFAEKCIRYNLIRVVNNSPLCILNKLNTHSLTGFANYAKHIFIQKYHDNCTIQNCCTCLSINNTNIHADYQFNGKSGVDATERILPGRPQGGVAIAWHKGLSHYVKPIRISIKRMCAVRMQLNVHKYMLIVCIYMPCDTYSNTNVSIEYDNCINCLEELLSQYEQDDIIMCGDWNTSFERDTCQTRFMTAFMERNDLRLSWHHPMANKSNTYGSFHVRSTNGLRVTPPISMKVGTRADNA